MESSSPAFRKFLYNFWRSVNTERFLALSMEYVYAALLLHGAKKEVNEDNLRKVVTAAGVSPDEVRIKALVSALGEINIEEALKNAMLAPTMAVASQSVAAPSAAPKAPAEEKKEEKKEEEALEGLASLFG
jgi:large subunit ribosomal protein L12